MRWLPQKKSAQLANLRGIYNLSCSLFWAGNYNPHAYNVLIQSVVFIFFDFLFSSLAASALFFWLTRRHTAPVRPRNTNSPIGSAKYRGDEATLEGKQNNQQMKISYSAATRPAKITAMRGICHLALLFLPTEATSVLKYLSAARGKGCDNIAASRALHYHNERFTASCHSPSFSKECRECPAFHPGAHH